MNVVVAADAAVTVAVTAVMTTNAVAVVAGIVTIKRQNVTITK